MIVTEEEAFSKWCPETEKDSFKSECLGSGCMWWEWLTEQNEDVICSENRGFCVRGRRARGDEVSRSCI